MFATMNVPHIRDTVHGWELDEVLQKFGNWVVSEGLHNLITAQVLHGHFPVRPDEALFETVDTENRVITTKVVPICDVRPDQASVWGFTRTGRPVPLVYTEDAVVSYELSLAMARAGAFLSAENLTRTLAIAALDEPFPMRRDQILFETTDEDARTQTTVPRPLETVQRDSEWQFIPSATVVSTRISLRGCDPGCAPLS